MWISLNDAFFSIVESKTDKRKLVVRSRMAGAIEKHFRLTAERTPSRDYLYRAETTRAFAALIISTAVEDIDYPDFKRSVKDKALAGAYNRCWLAMNDLQGETEGAGLYAPKRRTNARPPIRVVNYDPAGPANPRRRR